MGLYFSISALLIIILFMINFFSKQRVKNVETFIYKYLLIFTFAGLSLDIITCIMFNMGIDTNGFLYSTLAKFVFVYFEIWTMLFSYYVKSISIDRKKYAEILQKTAAVYLYLFVISVPFIIILPVHFEHVNGVVVPNGIPVMITYAISGLLILYSVYLTVRNHRNIAKKKTTPLYLFCILMIINFLIQRFFPDAFLINYLLSFTVLVMYFTIENPDVKMIEQLEVAKESADHANKAKTEFLSSMSHEIRTPLNAIIGFSECIRDAKTKDEAKENASDIISAANTLLETVNGILDISKIEAGKLEITKTNYDSIGLFNECAKLVKPRMDDKGLEFVSHFAKDIPKVLNGDYSNLKKIILNILTNAAKYTDQGSVKFDVHCVNKTVTTTLIISVTDTGRGIKQENIDKLFDKFERLDEKANTTIEGTGLGLAITKQLVHMMNGKITVQSAYGEGSTFTITIPQRIVADKSAEIVNKKESKKIQIEDFSGKTVLIVDDNKLNLKVASKVLEPFKVEVMTVSSGEECLEAIEMIKVDLILMDDMMPHMSGVDTLRKLQEKEGFKTPVVALTANAIAGMKEKYLKDGFNDYLAKPIERPELSRVLNKFFNK